jgi:hypothetical protein
LEGDGKTLTIGGAVTLARLEHYLEFLIEHSNGAISSADSSSDVPVLPAYATRGFSAMLNMLRWFASHQIRNVAVIAGNIVTAVTLDSFLIFRYNIIERLLSEPYWRPCHCFDGSRNTPVTPL